MSFKEGGVIFKKIYTHVINSSIHKGSGARSTAGVLLIPFTVIKTRVESGLFNYSGVLHALSKMFLYLISYPPPTSLHFLKTFNTRVKNIIVGICKPFYFNLRTCFYLYLYLVNPIKLWNRKTTVRLVTDFNKSKGL